MCTLEKRGEIFYLTFTGDDEHRLNPTLITTLLSHLRHVNLHSSPSSALVTSSSSSSKFFSNGFDLAWAARSAAEEGGTAVERLSAMVEMFRPVVKEMMEVRVPTVAAVTGHAAAAGMLFAMCHDYVLMRGDRGVLYMSELDIGMTFPDYFNAMMRSKIGSPAARRNVMLKAAKIRAAEAVSAGIVDSVHENGEKTLEAAVVLAEQLAKRKWNGEVYREIRKGLYPELCAVLGLKSKKVVASSKL